MTKKIQKNLSIDEVAQILVDMKKLSDILFSFKYKFTIEIDKIIK